MNKAKIGGIFEVTSGIFGMIYVGACIIVACIQGYFSSEEILAPNSELFYVAIGFLSLFLVISILVIFCGYFAIRKVRWCLALTGALFSMIMFFFLGIPATILITQARSEFNKPKTS
jgi:hypothetical protein